MDTPAFQQSSSSGLHMWHASKHINVTVTEAVPTSTMTILQTVFHSGSTITATSSVVVSTTSTVEFLPIDSNSILDTQNLQESTSSPLFSNTLVSPSLPTETSVELPLATSDPTPTTTGLIVSTFVTASTDSLGVHTFTKVTTIPHFQPSTPSRTPENDTNPSRHDSSPNVPMIILIVLGITGVCALLLLFIWWYRGRRRRGIRRNHIYPFSGGKGNLGERQPFGRLSNKRQYFPIETNPRHTINRGTDRSFGSSFARGATLTPYLEQTRTDEFVIGSSGGSSPHVRFEKPVGGSGPSTPVRTVPKSREGITQGDRPPTYYTNATGLAPTIATDLPRYCAVDPSPISELSEASMTLTTSTTPTASTPISPLAARGCQPARLSPFTPFGQKF